MTLAEIMAAKAPAMWRRMLSRWPALTRHLVDERLVRLMQESPKAGRQDEYLQGNTKKVADK